MSNRSKQNASKKDQIGEHYHQIIFISVITKQDNKINISKYMRICQKDVENIRQIICNVE
ncbi:unnamed protein product [Paramecium primaurelia]|uniref:Uncharacterized protein n=1 Tax=Paramecium primaurelia TaxID=5886 RepID=A0A8S1PEH4_PARPR|nr:unnamed protein product [Paramecium primaurelia]